MKKINAWLLILVLSVCCQADVLADLKIRFSIDPETALLNESVSVFLRLMNDSMYPLEIGPEGPARINVTVKTTEGREVRRLNQRPFFSSRRVMPDEYTDIMFDLNMFFDIQREDRYRVELEIVWNKRTYEANAQILDVVAGFELKAIRRTIPGYPDTDRIYSLRYWRREGGEKIFLRVEEPSNRIVHGVFALGSLLRFAEPQVAADRYGNVTVVHQSAPQRFTRTEFRSTGEGVSLVDQIYFPTYAEALRGKRDVLPPQSELPEDGDSSVRETGRR